MTESRQKAEITRKTNAEARKAARAAQWEQERNDKQLVGEAMRHILHDPNATTREKIFAAITIDHITSGVGIVIPLRAMRLYDDDVDIGAFKTAVDTIQAAQNIKDHSK